MRTHIVKSGDTLSEIAAKYNTTVDELVNLNKIRNPHIIFIGQEIKLPDDDEAYYANIGRKFLAYLDEVNTLDSYRALHSAFNRG